MDDEDGMESFEIDDRDIEYALNPGRRHFQTKDQATYGMWAQDVDSDDDSNRGRSSKKMKLSTPVSFVSGGVQTNPSKKIDKDDPKSLAQGTYQSKRNEDDTIVIDFARKTKKAQPKEVGAQVFAGMRTSSTSGSIDTTKFGHFLNHGNGSVVQRMMEKMGYKAGEGLGVTGQGIIEPVQAALRKGRGAVGAYGKEMTGPKFGESAADAQKRLDDGDGPSEQDEEQKPKPMPKGGWKKAQKVKTKYKTVDDVIEESSSSLRIFSSHTTTKVIDMTGPQQKVYSGYDSFSMKTKSEMDVEEEKREVFDVPELIHNLNLLIDLTEESVRRNTHQSRTLKVKVEVGILHLYFQDESTAMEYDLAKLEETLKEEEAEEAKMIELYEIIEGIAENKNPTMPEMQNLLTRLRTEYPHEYRLYNLETIAIPCVLPLIQRYFVDWRPLDPDHMMYGVQLMTEWKEVLSDQHKTTFGMNKTNFDEIPAYDRLLWDGWLPSLRRAALTWDPRDEIELMLKLIETWIPVVPTWIKENILDQIIVPRIGDRVNNWDPTKDIVPIHSWLIPWLHVLGDRIQSVMAPIRQKLAKALKMWEASDESALGILKPWRDVWAKGTFLAFLSQNIVPKLGAALQEMELDPRINPEYEEWHAVMGWLELIHPDIIVDVVAKNFFPRFYGLVCKWLDMPNRDIGEVKRWYGEWKTRIPPSIANAPVVIDALKRCLIAIGQSMQGSRVSDAPVPLMQAPVPQAQPTFMGQPTTQQLSMKDAIEMTAARNGLTYHPQKDRFKDGRQVFWFGAVSIYMDRGMVHVMDPVEFVWKPIGLDDLIRLGGGGV